jgi:hypothetical protein
MKTQREAQPPINPDDEENAVTEPENEAATVGEPDAVDTERAERRVRLLAGIPADVAALITDEELDKIEREERAKAETERKKLALKMVREELSQRARVEQNLIPASVLRSEEEQRRLGESVRFRIGVPEEGAGHRGQAGFRVDGFHYQNGQIYERPRAVFESLQANNYRTHLNELTFSTLDQHKKGGPAITGAQAVLAQHPLVFEILT